MIRFLSDILNEKMEAYIVGGSLRDILLNRSPCDVDIAVSENPYQFAQKLASRTGGRLVRMGKPGLTIYRVVSAAHIFDVSPVNGASIEEDLYNRDFTINAMAYSLHSKTIIDPAGGLRDLSGKQIRMVSDRAFLNDPVRLIRAYRIGASLAFEIEPATISAIRDNAHLLRSSAGERIRAELFKILRNAKSHHYILQMDDSGLLFSIFPELGGLKECFQSHHHLYDAFEHTMSAFKHLENILNDYIGFMSEIYSPISRPIDNKKSVLLKCAILLHDIGKPSMRTVDSKGNPHFYHHDHKSADMAIEIGNRLKLSTRETHFIDFIIRHHMQPLFLYQAHQKKTLTNRGLYRFFIKCGDGTPDLLLHSIADFKGKGVSEEHEAYIGFAKDLIRFFFSDYRPVKSQPPLITGHDLIRHFGLSPSPLFKKILNRVEEARLSKEITSRQSALKLAKKILRKERQMNIVLFGPNGSGKGTQGAILKDRFNIPHIESGAIFRENISKKTELGIKAKEYIDRGDLVPDEITIPMILNRLKQSDCKNGWLLDGFPRNRNQAVKLHEALNQAGIKVDLVIEITLAADIAKKRIMGRRLCENDNNHPNNIYIDAIKPIDDKCRVCGGDLKTRADDQDESAINKRHGIYYDTENGTLAAAYYFKDLARKNDSIRYITLGGTPGVKEVTQELVSKL
jgi:adenylate kinase